MTKDEIKARCRKAFLIVQDNHIFSIDQPSNVGANIYSDEEYAQKKAADLRIAHDTMECYKRAKGRKIKVCPVYLVPASKIDT